MRAQSWKIPKIGGWLASLIVGLLWFTPYHLSAEEGPIYVIREVPLVVDGSADDWGGPLRLGLGDHLYDVRPASLLAIDIFRLSHTFGECVDRVEEGFYMIFMFQGQALGDSMEAHYELYFDTDPVELIEGTPKGQPQEVWEDFCPDYRFRITGRDGRIETEMYQFWDGSRWVDEPQADAAQIEAAVGGQFFECRILWSSLGDYLERAAAHPYDEAPLKWALHATEAGFHDYYPDPGYFKPNGGLSAVTQVRSTPWGLIKSQYK